jgi:hypothetical protein
MHAESYLENLRERDDLEDLDLIGRILLKCVLEERVMTMLIELKRLVAISIISEKFLNGRNKEFLKILSAPFS